MYNVLKRVKNRFLDFYFLSYDHFCTQKLITHTHNSKNKYRRIFLVFFPFYTAHFTSLIKFPPFLRVGLQWRTQWGGQGAMAPPKPESQGTKLSFGPPPPFEVYKIYFQIYIIHYYLLYT